MTLTPSEIEEQRLLFEAEVIKGNPFEADRVVARNKEGGYITSSTWYGFKLWLAAVEANKSKIDYCAIEEAHIAGQIDAGVDPSWSNAQRYALTQANQVREIELPELSDISKHAPFSPSANHHRGYNSGIHTCRESLIKQGYRIKNETN